MKREVIENIRTLGEAALPHLWKDELGDVFVLTRYMEVIVNSKTVLGCCCWSRKSALQLQNMGLIFDVWETDDRIYTFKKKVENLPLILSLGVFTRRPHRNGRWLKSRERLLGHRILTLNVSNSELKELITVKPDGRTKEDEEPVIELSLESEYAIAK